MHPIINFQHEQHITDINEYRCFSRKARWSTHEYEQMKFITNNNKEINFKDATSKQLTNEKAGEKNDLIESYKSFAVFSFAYIY